MRERGVQSRRVKADGVELARRPGPPQRGGSNFWQVLAIIALIAATAGWTTVGVIALRGTTPPTTALASPSDSIDPNASFASDPPAVDTHDAVDLEALLPLNLNATPLVTQSWTGDGILTDDAWSTSMKTFLTSAGKAPTDLRVAQAYDPNQALDISIGVYQVRGVQGTAVHDALVNAWKGDYPDMTVSKVTLDGKSVTKGGFGQDTASSYLYIRGDYVFDIETTDEAIATAALKALPVPGASGPPSSVKPSGAPGSNAPAPSAS
ncbi:MAG: hypothetical protein QOI37_1550 [Chloroflexota bacterium]|nr:hypothetical protein [Chloroflexota bacterium]MEA2654323.1 hypothetical protein [Chloroflexota bacterium]